MKAAKVTDTDQGAANAKNKNLLGSVKGQQMNAKASLNQLKQKQGGALTSNLKTMKGAKSQARPTDPNSERRMV